MTELFEVVDGGLSTTIQDSGRRGHLSVGVPVSGPMDRLAFRLANALAGAAEGAAVLEMLFTGSTLLVTAESVRVAIIGARADIIHEAGDRHPLDAGRSVRLKRGDRLAVGAFDRRAVAYLAVEGGFLAPERLGSTSTYRPGGFGGLDGRALRRGDRLIGAIGGAGDRMEQALGEPFDAGLEHPARVVLGPQDDHFTTAGIETFVSTEYRVCRQADRMGLRFEGAAIAHAGGHDIVSDGVVFGSIQVPGDGMPIMLAADAQTTGGYPKIATVISADLPLIGRRRPGDAVRFRPVTRKEAEAAARVAEERFHRAVDVFREVIEGARLDLARLYEENLIGGVVDGSR